MGKLFQLHIVIALLCLFSIEQHITKESTLESIAPKSYSSTFERINAPNLLELTEEKSNTRACSIVLNTTFTYKFLTAINLVLTDCQTVTHGSIPFQTDTSPPHA